MVQKLHDIGVLKIFEFSSDAEVLNEVARRMDKGDKWSLLRDKVIKREYKTLDTRRKLITVPEDMLSTWILKVDKHEVNEEEEDEYEHDSDVTSMYLKNEPEAKDVDKVCIVFCFIFKKYKQGFASLRNQQCL